MECRASLNTGRNPLAVPRASGKDRAVRRAAGQQDRPVTLNVAPAERDDD
jgi:hypothetical protein